MSVRQRKLTAAISEDSVIGPLTLGPAPSYFQNVGDFHAKFNLPYTGEVNDPAKDPDPLPPTPLDSDTRAYRIRFMIEELAEFAESQGAALTADRLRGVMACVDADEGLAKQTLTNQYAGLADGADALADLVYVALGTAHLMRLPFDECWAEVQRANMTKERASGKDDPRSKRAHHLDVVKPAGWRGPDHWPILYARAVR